MKKMFLTTVVLFAALSAQAEGSKIKCYSIREPQDDEIQVTVDESAETVMTVSRSTFYGRQVVGEYYVNRTVGLTVIGAGINFVNHDSGIELKISPAINYAQPTNQRFARLEVKNSNYVQFTKLICEGLVYRAGETMPGKLEY